MRKHYDLARMPKSYAQLPSSLRSSFENPPLLASEKVEAYRELFCILAHDIQPIGAIEWLWLNDVTYLCWEIMRLRAFKSYVIEEERASLRTKSGISLAFDKMEAEHPDLPLPEISKLVQSMTLAAWCKLAPKCDTERDSKQAFENANEKLERIEDRIISAERRRNSVLREIEIRREILARRLRDASDRLIEGKALKRKLEAA